MSRGVSRANSILLRLLAWPGKAAKQVAVSRGSLSALFLNKCLSTSSVKGLLRRGLNLLLHSWRRSSTRSCAMLVKILRRQSCSQISASITGAGAGGADWAVQRKQTRHSESHRAPLIRTFGACLAPTAFSPPPSSLREKLHVALLPIPSCIFLKRPVCAYFACAL